GGYVFGDARQDIGFLSGLVDAANFRLGVGRGFQILSLEYPFAPENPYPAAVNHVTAAYAYIIQTVPSETIVLGGHSAGGGLALAVCQSLRALDVPRPRGLALFSPFVELRAAAASYAANHGRDVLTAGFARECARCYVCAEDGPADPAACPLREARFAGYPRDACVYYGSREVLRDDIAEWARRAREGGVAVEEVLAPGGWHVPPTRADGKGAARVVDFLARIAAGKARANSAEP
ncbi:MAG: Alpha/Beta hydrolase protein, partial [Olpidium bornovanus]